MQIRPDANPSIHRFSERAFRRYEPIIAAAVNAYPESIQFSPVALATNTAEARLRDAIRSLVVNRWNTYINLDELQEIIPDIIIKQIEGDVYVGPSFPTSIRTYVDAVPGAATPAAAASVAKVKKTLESPTNQEIASVMILANRGFFQNEPIILSKVPQEFYAYFQNGEYLTKHPNIVVDYQKNTDSFILL